MINPTRGDVDGNWKFVNNHRLLLYIDSVVLTDGTQITDPVALKDYAMVVNLNDPQATTTEVITSNDGAAQVTVKAGPNIDDVDTVYMGVEDETQAK